MNEKTNKKDTKDKLMSDLSIQIDQTDKKKFKTQIFKTPKISFKKRRRERRTKN